jgi:phospholipid/cholesterol/gamma-HCH transport system substrate-binding protein
METRANLIKIGLFVLAVILAGFGGAFWLLKGDQKGPRSVVEVDFEGSVGGLLPGAAVSYNGIKVGDVTSVQFAGTDPNKVVVLLSIDSNAPIRKDSSIGLGFSGLTGYATVQITGGTAEAPWLFDQTGGRPIIKADSQSVQDLMGGARKILGRADEIASTVQKLINDAAPSLSKIVKNVETVTDSLATNSQNIDKFLGSVGTAADTLTRVSGRIDKLTADLDDIATSVDRAKISQIVTNVATISDQIAKSTTHLQDTVDDLHATIADTRKVVAAIDPAKVSSAIDSLASVTKFLSTKTGEVDDILASTKAATANINTITAAVSEKTPQLKQFIGDAQSAMQQIAIASQRLDPILAKVDGIVGSDAGQGLFAQGRTFLTEATEAAKAFKETSVIYGNKANDITEAIKAFVATSRNTLGTVNRAVSDFDRNPQQLLFGAKSTVPEYNRK